MMERCYLPSNDFNPRSPWGERPGLINKHTHRSHISIHAPRGGSDQQMCDYITLALHFNPRSPWGERPAVQSYLQVLRYFNPRSPWGERPRLTALSGNQSRFQSTLPVGGATHTSLPFVIR